MFLEILDLIPERGFRLLGKERGASDKEESQKKGISLHYMRVLMWRAKARIIVISISPP